MSNGKVGRRSFLRVTATAAAAAPYVLTSQALGGPDKAAASERLNMASIGFRGQGGGHFRALLGNRDVQVTGLCDVDRGVLYKGLERTAKGTFGTSDYRELLAKVPLDGVVIATPDHWHVPISMAAIKAGADVYCEKPLTLTIREGRRLSDAARRYRAVFQTGSQQRSGRQFRQACELVRNGYLGKIHTVKVGIPTRAGSAAPWTPQPVPEDFDYEMWLGPAPWAPYHPDRCHYKFRFVRDYSGGDITNWGAHHLDIAQWGLGADDAGPIAVEGHGDYNKTGLHNVFHNVHVEFQYPGGVKLILDRGGGTEFIGDKGSVYVSRGTLRAEPASLLKVKFKPGDVRLMASGSHMGQFLRAIRTREATICPAEVGHRSATVCHLSNIAMTLRRPLKWDPKAEVFPGDEEATRMTWRPRREPWRL